MMVFFFINIEKVKRQLAENNEYMPPEFVTWLEKHPELIGDHRVSLIKRKSGEYYYRLNDHHPPTEKQKAVWFKEGYDERRFIYKPEEKVNGERAD